MNSLEYYNKIFGCSEKKPKNFTEDEIIWRLEIMPIFKATAIIPKSYRSKREKAISMRIRNNQHV